MLYFCLGTDPIIVVLVFILLPHKNIKWNSPLIVGIKGKIGDNYFLDMIAIPDFQAGAMENWGLITYRETALLFDPEHSSTSNKQRVAIVVSHELAHQVSNACKISFECYNYFPLIAS